MYPMIPHTRVLPLSQVIGGMRGTGSTSLRGGLCLRDHSRSFIRPVTTVSSREGIRRLIDTPSPSSPRRSEDRR